MFVHKTAGRYLLLSCDLDEPRLPSDCVEGAFLSLDEAKEHALKRAPDCPFGWDFEVYDLQEMKTVWEYCRPRNEREVKEEAERRANGPQFVLTGTTLIKAPNALHFRDAPGPSEPAPALMGATGEEDFGRRAASKDLREAAKDALGWFAIALVAWLFIAAYHLR